MNKDSNSTTLKTYDDNVQVYIDKTPQELDGFNKQWVDHTLSLLPSGAKILELGSAFGRDATYIKNLGFDVITTDASKGFVDYLRSHGFKNAYILDAIKDDLSGPYDLVYANAVFLHFTEQELKKVLVKIKNSLKPHCLLAFSVKKGEGTEWTSEKMGAPRFFKYWQPEPLKKLLLSNGYKILKFDTAKSPRRNLEWLHVIAMETSD